MTPTLLCILLFAAGAVLLAAELLLPTQGLLGVLGGGAIIGAIGIAFYINQWIGLTLLIVTLGVSPFLVVAALNIWPRTPVGRRMLLPPVESPVQPPRVGLGQTGVALSELRPMGLCDFGDTQHEAMSETGMISTGSRVKVVSIEEGKLVVRRT